ncbi:alpha/beta hydrolase [Streptomyces sp. NPDC088124]|uniref:alpha/beta fold hydrolase n=1 Tax=Streptomyces sp. NPDC088124 TaxID=3154654 RepID=UPI0034384AB5
MSRPPTFTPPPCARARMLATRRGRFAVLDARPAGEPHGTVLMLPGFSGSKEDFIALLEPLAAAGYRTVAVDGRGQYETDGPDTQEAYTRAELAADVLAQAAALDTPVHLLGHSLGGQISRAAVLLDRDPFLSLTLMSSGPAEVAPGQRERIKLLSDTLAVMTMAQVWEVMETMEPPEDTATATATATTAAPAPDNGADLRERWVRTSPAQLIATGAQLSAEPDRVAELAAVQRLPLHVISGERDDVWPVPLLDSMARRLGARRTVVAGAEHSPNTDRPAETAAALADFWDGLY